MMNKPVSHEARRKIHTLEARVAELERALQRINEIAPDDLDSGLAVQEIARTALPLNAKEQHDRQHPTIL